MSDITEPMPEGLFNQSRNVTHNDEVLEHLITDEQLTMLDMSSRDHIVEIFWASLGLFFGSLLPALGSASMLFDQESSFSWVSLIECMICFAALVVAVLMAIFWWNRAQTSSTLIEDIRNRTKARIS